MRNAWVQARLAYRGMYRWGGTLGFVSNVVLRAPLTLAVYAFVARSALDTAQTRRSVIGMILYGIPTTIIGGITQMFSNDREDGVLPVSVIAAESRWRLYALRALWHLPNAIVAIASGIVFSVFVLDLNIADVSWAALVACVVAVALSVAAYGLLAGNLALVLREYVAAMSLSSGLLLVCSGVVIPSDRLPTAIEWAANGLPLTHGLRGFRAAFAGASFGSVWSDVAWELLLAAGYLAIGSLAFVGITERARVTGSLELTEA
jgi:ABC-2 type transport system permease protein